MTCRVMKFRSPRGMRRCLAITAALLLATAADSGATEHVQRLADGWEHYQGSLGSTWEVCRGDAASDNAAASVAL